MVCGDPSPQEPPAKPKVSQLWLQGRDRLMRLFPRSPFPFSASHTKPRIPSGSPERAAELLLCRVLVLGEPISVGRAVCFVLGQFKCHL